MSGENIDFKDFPNVMITGIKLDSLVDVEQSVLYQVARYCQAMTEADLETMRDIVMPDMMFTHMSGMRQTREEYFSDIQRGRLCYYTIGIEKPKIQVNGNQAVIAYTSVLNANAYGARGTFRMTGSHYYENRNCKWQEVNRP